MHDLVHPGGGGRFLRAWFIFGTARRSWGWTPQRTVQGGRKPREGEWLP